MKLPQKWIDDFINENQFEEFSLLPKPQFSEKYYRAKESLLAVKKTRRPFKAVLAAAVLILMVVLAACTEQLRDYVLQIFDDFSSYVSTREAHGISDFDIEMGYIAEGYLLTTEAIDDTSYTAEFEKEGTDDKCVINVYVAKRINQNVDNEKTKETNFIVNEIPLKIFRFENTGETIVLYLMESISVKLEGDLSDKEIIGIFKNLTIKQKGEE